MDALTIWTAFLVLISLPVLADLFSSPKGESP